MGSLIAHLFVKASISREMACAVIAVVYWFPLALQQQSRADRYAMGKQHCTTLLYGIDWVLEDKTTYCHYGYFARYCCGVVFTSKFNDHVCGHVHGAGTEACATAQRAQSLRWPWLRAMTMHEHKCLLMLANVWLTIAYDLAELQHSLHILWLLHLSSAFIPPSVPSTWAILLTCCF